MSNQLLLHVQYYSNNWGGWFQDNEFIWRELAKYWKRVVWYNKNMKIIWYNKVNFIKQTYHNSPLQGAVTLLTRKYVTNKQVNKKRLGNQNNTSAAVTAASAAVTAASAAVTAASAAVTVASAAVTGMIVN